MITVQQVAKTFAHKRVLHNITFTIKRGETVALLGKNGAGKTTLLSLLLGLDNATAGTVNVATTSVGAMLQETTFPPFIRVGELIDVFRSYYKQPLPKATLLQYSGLQEQQSTFVTELSGGQARRLLFALALAGNPKLLFLDEPTVGMDVEARQQFWQTMEQLKAAGKTIVLTTHHMNEVQRMAERVIVIDEGDVKMDAQLQALGQFGQTDDEAMLQLLGGMNDAH